MSEPATEASRSGPRQRRHDWIKTVLVILAVGPPIGGFTFGLLLSGATVLNNPHKWEAVPVTVIFSTVTSYVLGLPMAGVAVALFLMLYRFGLRGTARLAALCGVISATLLIALNEMMRRPVPAAFGLTLKDFTLQLIAFGIPSAVSAWACWRMTKPIHRLS
jgi:energy-converting hydrogenase Eha subunit A